MNSSVEIWKNWIKNPCPECKSMESKFHIYIYMGKANMLRKCSNCSSTHEEQVEMTKNDINEIILASEKPLSEQDGMRLSAKKIIELHEYCGHRIPFWECACIERHRTERKVSFISLKYTLVRPNVLLLEFLVTKECPDCSNQKRITTSNE